MSDELRLGRGLFVRLLLLFRLLRRILASILLSATIGVGGILLVGVAVTLLELEVGITALVGVAAPLLFLAEVLVDLLRPLGTAAVGVISWILLLFPISSMIPLLIPVSILDSIG